MLSGEIALKNTHYYYYANAESPCVQHIAISMEVYVTNPEAKAITNASFKNCSSSSVPIDWHED